MFDLTTCLWMIPGFPLLGSVLIALFGRRVLKEQSHWPCIFGAIGACVLSLYVMTQVNAGNIPEPGNFYYFTWFEAGSVPVQLSLRIDGLTSVMLVMITFIATFIAIYSAGYMHHDPGYPRFFAAFSLFLFFMTGLVLANNFIILYACWEGVGLCSYLLIGFWFYKPSAAAAARKAFLVTRLGDIGLFIGIMMLWTSFGAPLDHHLSEADAANRSGLLSLEYDTIFQNVQTQMQVHPEATYPVLLTACLCLFLGAAGKSAQFPLHVWLPDAMEGPTPVSALIHAATMVTAGVYLVARCTPLFAHVPAVQEIIAWSGATTMLLAALIALTQTDLKRVLAYSTLSQLGYMFLALGSALMSQNLVVVAVTAAIFHLFTHAFFKALLFLGAGSVMHAMGDIIDMRKFSGLRKVLPHTHMTFLIGSLALAGFPLLSGFWSKDEILDVVFHAGLHSALHKVLFAMAIVTAGLTAFYTFRAYFMTFWGEQRIPPEAYSHHHGHADHADHLVRADHSEHPAPAHVTHEPTPGKSLESPPIMTAPLWILSIGALGVGAALGPTGIFEHFLEAHWFSKLPHSMNPEQAHGHNLPLMIISSLIGLAGIGVAYVLYVKSPAIPAQLARSASVFYELSRNRFYIDELYEALIVRPFDMLAYVLRIIDQYLIDGLVDLIGQLPLFIGYFLRPIQNGLVQFYALLMVLGMTGVVVAVLMK